MCFCSSGARRIHSFHSFSICVVFVISIFNIYNIITINIFINIYNTLFRIARIKLTETFLKFQKLLFMTDGHITTFVNYFNVWFYFVTNLFVDNCLTRINLIPTTLPYHIKKTIECEKSYLLSLIF